jgi:hypothetical protein
MTARQKKMKPAIRRLQRRLGLSTIQIWCACLTVLTLAAGAPAFSKAAEAPALCEGAAQSAASETGVPLPVLHAIAIVESGRNASGHIRPWPWTVNVAGKGYWFETRELAVAFAQARLDEGQRSFDVGCYQINYRWHGGAFPSLGAMFEPGANARYAAGFLRQLHDEFGDWSAAAGAYHSRTEEHATAYRTRFDKVIGKLSPKPAPNLTTADAGRALPAAAIVTDSASTRKNGFPLLRAGGVTTIGSLVPLQNDARPLFGPEG